MQIRIDNSKAFADAVSWSAKHTSLKSAQLAGLLIAPQASGVSHLVLSAGDGNLVARSTVAATIEGELETLCVSGALLRDISQNLPQAPVSLKVEDGRVVLTCGSARFVLPNMVAQSHPLITQTVAMPGEVGTVEADAFATALSQVVGAASRDITQTQLSGVHLSFKGTKLTLAATDRLRLATRTIEWAPKDATYEHQVLLPASLLSEAAKGIDSVASHLSLRLSETGTQSAFTGGGRALTLPSIEAAFPEYENLIPAEFSTTVVASSAGLVEALKRASLVLVGPPQIKLTLSATDESSVAGGTGANGDAQAAEKLDVRVTGEDLVLACNPGYLIEALKHANADTVRLGFNGSAKPVVVTVEGDATASYRHLVMPVRLT